KRSSTCFAACATSAKQPWSLPPMTRKSPRAPRVRWNWWTAKSSRPLPDMPLEIIGHNPFARDDPGAALTRIGTLFPEYGVLYTADPGVHALQRLSFIEHLNSLRSLRALPPLTPDEEEVVCVRSVDLVFESEEVLIRPDPDQIDLAFVADELLQKV